MKFSLFTALSLASMTVFSAEISLIQRLECNGTNVSATIEVSTGIIRGKINGRAFNNNTIQIVEVVPNLPSEENMAIGGATVGRLGVGQIYVLFTHEQSTKLNSIEQAQIMHLNSDGIVKTYPAECRVTF